ncbi:uncharacterized protein B0I36DRAFT_390210 [Microdochium trichocladiopsis]|uniref:Rhodopsin domain-containing protein n=1 Tax=Microdochium trichocladiopsis TaxID=1682393 RepID=A0A9P8YG08_9PEZI|nr:uncharacterized protein B0I36DRAFT_390210 [Microdochium trichocladiopsis]KAH7039590.1 hypothetical protein B0I36DRAFT_390210 [Microdochium trichocladiopsis]
MSGPVLVDGVLVLTPAPEGYVVNLQDPARQYTTEHYAVFGVLGTLATVALAQRLYVKIHLSTGLGVDDGPYCTQCMRIMSMSTQALLTHSLRIGGMGVHVFEMPLERVIYALTLAYVAGGTFMVCNGAAKLSLLCFYLKLSPVKLYRVAVWSSIVIVALLTTIITVLLLIHCTPVKSAYDITLPGQCLDVGVLYMANAVTNIITDLMLFLIPIPTIIGLQMGRRQKIGALLVFAVGSVTIMTSAIRLGLLPNLLKATDITWDAAPANIFSFVEANLFIICGSVPTLRKFFKHVAPKLIGSYADSSQYAHREYRQSYGYSSHSRSRKEHGAGRYDRFGKDDNELRQLPPSVLQPHAFSTYPSSPKGEDVEFAQGKTGNSATAEAQEPVRGDDGSEKAILTTTTVNVHYE